MVVFLGRRAGRQHAQAARHAEVQDEMAVAAVDEEIFPAAANGLYGAARERKDVARYRPAQARVAHRHAAADGSRQQGGREGTSLDSSNSHIPPSVFVLKRKIQK